jgi:hypothetical protein
MSRCYSLMAADLQRGASRRLIAIIALACALSCSSSDRCTGPVIVVVTDKQSIPLCGALVSVVSGGERIPLDTPATCRWAYSLEIAESSVMVEVSAEGFETRTLTVAARGTMGRTCGGSGCEVVALAPVP